MQNTIYGSRVKKENSYNSSERKRKKQKKQNGVTDIWMSDFIG